VRTIFEICIYYLRWLFTTVAVYIAWRIAFSSWLEVGR